MILAKDVFFLIHFQFETWHVVAVCAVLVVLHSAETFCRCLQACILSCENIIFIENCAAFLRQIVLFLSFAQPFLLCIILLYHTSIHNRVYSNTVFVSTDQLYCLVADSEQRAGNISAPQYVNVNETHKSRFEAGRGTT